MSSTTHNISHNHSSIKSFIRGTVLGLLLLPLLAKAQTGIAVG